MCVVRVLLESLGNAGEGGEKGRFGSLRIDEVRIAIFPLPIMLTLHLIIYTG
ncbi:hypothetical protein BDQ12DRAFT_688144 [Crucibulum laeve]|uniref:Uncharacterized protein n=1 Tax=Crucibulum laeve TaxID=68775 RepID=A0A5C3LQT8_9AGAR|nr:hypothetical protein BDQ12DRAFT_688144 [Crucibulum laeve]